MAAQALNLFATIEGHCLARTDNRAVQLYYWNGSNYTATGWDERTDGSNAAIGVGVTTTDAYSLHRLGFNDALYAQAPSAS